MPQSVLARLKNTARDAHLEYQQVLTRYGLERMLYRRGWRAEGFSASRFDWQRRRPALGRWGTLAV